MADDAALLELMRVIGAGDNAGAQVLLHGKPELATRALGIGGSRSAPTEFFLETCRAQIYRGDTALHVAAFAYDVELVRRLVAMGADVRAKNRRGAEPLHAAANGSPGANDARHASQADVIAALVEVGAAVDAPAAGGVTPLHRAVRNRCPAAVRALLAAGADPQRPNDSGSTAIALAHHNTGRSGSGSPEAHAAQAEILAIFAAHRRSM
ncbi:MAG TPA: ankyrin repeat domain-containing protein [Ilumatobacteraceae bacterium]|jgi:hypothetical protein